ncbi:MAG: exodeoxyribonuclease VII large subunit [Methanotrichaceae archaeon]|nr:exodeoxyribonuclease VII large subunit [Methanotrichaceae archaeon]
MTDVFTVGQLSSRIKERLSGDARLRDLWARGELSNVTNHRSGHSYFTLKDNEAGISCVLFRSHAARVEFPLKDGLNVLVFGDVEIYRPRGSLQLVAKGMRLDSGVGLRQLELERMKKLLSEEGLFDAERKRKPPRYPESIGIVTSPDGAALRDVLRTIGGYPARIILSPATVQGEGASESVAQGVRALKGLVDLVIVCRGGGSAEDLWPFNSEAVARAIYNCDVPVIAGIGHETDVTIADLVADIRAATPTAAAKAAVPDLDDLRYEMGRFRARIERATEALAGRQRTRLDYLERRLSARRISSLVGERRQRLDYLSERLSAAELRKMEEMRHRLGLLGGRLQSASPLATLSRGYAIARTPDGRLVQRARKARIGEVIELTFCDGAISCRVEKRLEGYDLKGGD